ncbi:hypothetical protein [Streptomyces sp. NPDC005262]|uniref:hypothetical protein n=1 Tax=Streptomyces sp. NPDC005262 TaxID=3364710 RepID=UPI0036A0BCDE
MATPEFRPTHVVPSDGMSAWEAPDMSRPTEPLDPLLPVQLVGRRGDWGRILCANGWSAWVDGRLLVSVPHGPPEPGQPLARTADPRPLMARVQESLARYRGAAEELTEGRIDGETFRRRTQGLRVGMVVDGEAVWLYDAERERWVYCDGTQLSTYASSAGPGHPGEAPVQGTGEMHAPEPEPTQIVDPARSSAGPGRPNEAPVHPGTDEMHEPTQIVDPARPAAYRQADPADAGPTQLLWPVDEPRSDSAHPPTRTGDA